MNPELAPPISEEKGVYRFTLKGLNVSLANAIRRTILSDIQINVVDTENPEKCNIEINTCRLHNEIIKHRLSCIPINMKELDLLPDKYLLEVDEKNNTDNIMYVTTEHFKIKNKENGNYLSESEMRRIFPPCEKTQMFIDFVRLRPKMGDTIPGEQIKLTAEFSVNSSLANSAFNVVSKCSYGNTLNVTNIDKIWEDQELKLVGEQMTKQEIEIQKKNFMLLDAQRHFVPDSFDFIIQSIGIYDNKELVKKACEVLNKKFVQMVESVDSDIVPINNSETTIDFCYDIILENEDYTIGKVLEYILYERFYQGEKTLSFCGFKKFHPHNTESVVRIAFNENSDKNTVRQILRKACVEAADVFKKVYLMF